LEHKICPDDSAPRRIGQETLVRGQILQVREVYRVEAEIVCANRGVRETRTVEITARDTPFSFTLTFRPETVVFDPEYKILRWTEELSINIQERALLSDEYVGELLPYCG
jgi:hypothetical protein